MKIKVALCSEADFKENILDDFKWSQCIYVGEFILNKFNIFEKYKSYKNL